MNLPRSGIVAFRITLSVTLVVIMYFATTQKNLPVVEDLNDKFSHFLAFGTLAFLGDFSFPQGRFDFRKFLWLLSYGLLIEVVQYFLPDRTFSLVDVLADCLGIVTYWASYRCLKYVPLLQRRWV